MINFDALAFFQMHTNKPFLVRDEVKGPQEESFTLVKEEINYYFTSWDSLPSGTTQLTLKVNNENKRVLLYNFRVIPQATITGNHTLEIRSTRDDGMESRVTISVSA